ncbi:MAG: hypothetical protein J6Y02_02190 [Pseudobutyrivibrio sp.]|nr:hypothetical protein [Pseudobutyrivibrio sp.]
MIKHFCDRCKKEIDYRNTRILCISNTIDPYKNNDDDIQAERVYELCTTCVNKVLDVIHMVEDSVMSHAKELDKAYEDRMNKGADDKKEEKDSRKVDFDKWFNKATSELDVPANIKVRLKKLLVNNARTIDTDLIVYHFSHCTDKVIDKWRNCGKIMGSWVKKMRGAAIEEFCGKIIRY